MQYVEAEVTMKARIRVALENDDVNVDTIFDSLGVELDGLLTDHFNEPWPVKSVVDGETDDGDDCEVPFGVETVFNVSVEVGSPVEVEGVSA